MNIIILDDYQDAVRKLKCASLLEPFNAKVFTNTVKGIGQLSVRLRDAEVLVLIRERTQFPRALLEKLPRLKLISQTGKVGPHIDVAACTRLGIAVAEGVGSPVAPAELRKMLDRACEEGHTSPIGTAMGAAFAGSKLGLAKLGRALLAKIMKGGRPTDGRVTAAVDAMADPEAPETSLLVQLVAQLLAALDEVPEAHFLELEERFEELLGVPLERPATGSPTASSGDSSA